MAPRGPNPAAWAGDDEEGSGHVAHHEPFDGRDDDAVDDVIERLEWADRKEDDAPPDRRWLHLTRRTALSGGAAGLAALILPAGGGRSKTTTTTTSAKAPGSGGGSGAGGGFRGPEKEKI